MLEIRSLFSAYPPALLESWMHLVQACCWVEVRVLSFSIAISIVVLVSCLEVIILHGVLLEVLALLVGCFHCRRGWRTPACSRGWGSRQATPKWGLPSQEEDEEPGWDINLDRGWNSACFLDWGVVLSSEGVWSWRIYFYIVHIEANTLDDPVNLSGSTFLESAKYQGCQCLIFCFKILYFECFNIGIHLKCACCNQWISIDQIVSNLHLGQKLVLSEFCDTKQSKN